MHSSSGAMKAAADSSEKKRGEREGLSAIDLVALQAARADVTRFDLAVFHEGDLLDVRLKGALGLTVGVTDIVARRLTLSANTANSRHSKPPEGRDFSSGTRMRTGAFPCERNNDSISTKKNQ